MLINHNNNNNYNQRNLIIYDNKIKNYKQHPEHSKWLSTSLPVYKVYYGDVYNPPFFNNIISFRNNSLEDVQQIWNMTLIGGKIMIEPKYKEYFKDYLVNNKNTDFIVVKKTNIITYIFPKYRVVDFIIAGTMKGGTTAGILNLSKHPDISMVEKEIHYFDHNKNFQKGIDWYKKHFNYSKKMVGDKNHDVMYEYNCLERVQAINPQIKIILFLRNPIERAYSHWKMTRDLFNNKNSFEYCIMDEINNRMGENRTSKIAFWYHFVQRGFYYEQIQEMLKYFSMDNIYITITEKVRNNMDEEYQKIFKFLNLPEFHSNFEEVFSSKNKDSLDQKNKLYIMLQKLYKKDVENLEKMLGYKTSWFNN